MVANFFLGEKLLLLLPLEMCVSELGMPSESVALRPVRKYVQELLVVQYERATSEEILR